MRRSPSFSSRAGWVSASKRSLSEASAALEMSSRRKISLLEYSEWIISCSSCLTSVWKPRVSFWVCTVMGRVAPWGIAAPGAAAGSRGRGGLSRIQECRQPPGLNRKQERGACMSVWEGGGYGGPGRGVNPSMGPRGQHPCCPTVPAPRTRHPLQGGSDVRRLEPRHAWLHFIPASGRWVETTAGPPRMSSLTACHPCP